MGAGVRASVSIILKSFRSCEVDWSPSTELITVLHAWHWKMIRNVKSDFCPALTQSCFIKIAVSFKHNIIVACDFSVLCFPGSKPFMCKICNFATAQLGDARNHVKRHLGMREYKCDICGWVTRSMPFLRVTIRRVEGGQTTALLTQIWSEGWSSHYSSGHLQEKVKQ